MTYFEMGVRFQHDCPITHLSQKYPSAVLAWWCNHVTDVVEATYEAQGDLTQFQADLDRTILRADGSYRIKTSTASSIQFVSKCNCYDSSRSTSTILERHNCLAIYPVIVTDGWEWYRVVAFHEKDVRLLFKELDRTGRVEVVSKRVEVKAPLRETFVVSISNLTGGLTNNQAVALSVALENGYYSIPKNVTTDKIAARLGVSRPTFEEHLRKAESKVLKSVAPYIRFTKPTRRRDREEDERPSAPTEPTGVEIRADA